MDKHIVLPVKVLRDGDANRTELTREAQYSFTYSLLLVQYYINLYCSLVLFYYYLYYYTTRKIVF
jgi:hypothetical protein